MSHSRLRRRGPRSITLEDDSLLELLRFLLESAYRRCWASTNALGGLARRCPPASRHGATPRRRHRRPRLRPRRRSAPPPAGASSPIVGIESSRSSDGLIPRRAAARLECPRDLLADIPVRDPGLHQAQGREGRRVVQVAQRGRAGVGDAFVEGDVVRPPRGAELHAQLGEPFRLPGGVVSATAETVPRIRRAFRSRSRGKGIWDGSL